MIRKSKAWWIGLSLCGPAWAGLNTMPAARVHVRHVDGAYYRFTSKLAQVVEMNFTLGFDHPEGKANIGAMLDRIAADYGSDSVPAFAIRKFTGPERGASFGLPDPVFSLEDLQAADVIVTNNVSNLNVLKARNAAAATAFETAVRGGKSVLGFHASAEGDGGWAFYDDFLNPRDYSSHSNRIAVSVYRDSVESRHVTLEGVLALGTPTAVPMGVDAAGKEITLDNVIARKILTEASHFGRNLLADSVYRPLTTPLLRYNPNDYALGDMPSQYRFAGGNLYAFFIRSGSAKSAYFSGGHASNELNSGSTSFDGGTGDYERFFAQMLFYLAGYAREKCGDRVDCAGLPLVDSSDRIIGSVTGIPNRFGRAEFFEAGEIGFLFAGAGPWAAALLDLRGRAVASRSGTGEARIGFNASGLRPGVYCLRVSAGSRPPRSKMYVVPMPGTGAGR